MIISTTVQVVISGLAIVSYALSLSLYAKQILKSTSNDGKTAVLFASLGILFHGIVAYSQLNTILGIDLGIQSSAVLVTWVISIFLLIALIRLPIASLFVVILPLSIIVLSINLISESSYVPRNYLAGDLIIHIIFSLIAYSTLLMASSQALILALQEKNLRRYKKVSIVKVLPPLETMEALLFWMLWMGILFLSLAIASGFAFMEDMFAQHVVHHTVLSTSAWLTYATLLIGNHFFGWRGIRAIKWALLSFGLLVLGYFGSKFVLEVVL